MSNWYITTTTYNTGLHRNTRLPLPSYLPSLLSTALAAASGSELPSPASPASGASASELSSCAPPLESPDSFAEKRTCPVGWNEEKERREQKEVKRRSNKEERKRRMENGWDIDMMRSGRKVNEEGRKIGMMNEAGRMVVSLTSTSRFIDSMCWDKSADICCIMSGWPVRSPSLLLPLLGRLSPPDRLPSSFPSNCRSPASPLSLILISFALFLASSISLSSSAVLDS